jgi:hypothetical protein
MNLTIQQETQEMKLADIAKRVSIKTQPGARVAWDKLDDWQKRARGYTCTLVYRGRRMTVDFWMGTDIGHEPTSGDVLASLLSDASTHDNSSSFEDWAADLGLDPDSRAAERTYRQVARLTAQLKRLLGDEYDSFMMAEQD